MRAITCLLLVTAALLAATAAFAQTPMGTAFTFQGELRKGGLPYNGTVDLVLRMYDDPAAGNQIGGDVAIAGATVTNGLFVVTPDFGPGAFDGNARWLQVNVLTPGDADYTTLDPRQPLTPAPYALYAGAAPTSGGGSSQWANDPAGIEYQTGSVGIGIAATASAKLRIAMGASATGNPLWISAANPNYAAIAFGNTGANGYGLYDPSSGRHYLAGSLGIGTVTPTFPLDVVGTGTSIRATANGFGSAAGQAAVTAVGTTSGFGAFRGIASGVAAISTDGRGVAGYSTNSVGVSGDCATAGTYGFLGTPNEGIYGYSPTALHNAATFTNTAAGGVAMRANGIAQVTTLQILGADLAESFPLSDEQAEPGTVLAIADDASGALHVCHEAYSARVAGVVSGANGLNAGVILKGQDFGSEGHAAVALSGRVWVKCDAGHAPIHVGDLLTSADRAGYAMRASDGKRRSGATLGKAMTALESGTGYVLVLVSLQ